MSDATNDDQKLVVDRWKLELALRPPTDHQATAALALYGEPFGFTREDVKELQEAIGDVEANIVERGSFEDSHKVGLGIHPTITRLRSLADRIEALLPPENTK